MKGENMVTIVPRPPALNVFQTLPPSWEQTHQRVSHTLVPKEDGCEVNIPTISPEYMHEVPTHSGDIDNWKERYYKWIIDRENWYVTLSYLAYVVMSSKVIEQASVFFDQDQICIKAGLNNSLCYMYIPYYSHTYHHTEKEIRNQVERLEKTLIEMDKISA